MRRREFIALFGSATAWPVAAHAQRPKRVRRIGVLIDLSPSSAQAKERYTGIVAG